MAFVSIVLKTGGIVGVAVVPKAFDMLSISNATLVETYTHEKKEWSEDIFISEFKDFLQQITETYGHYEFLVSAHDWIWLAPRCPCPIIKCVQSQKELLETALPRHKVKAMNAMIDACPLNNNDTALGCAIFQAFTCIVLQRFALENRHAVS